MVALRAKDVCAHEFRVRREDTGELRFLCHEGRVVERDPCGAATILAGASHDVTERRLKQEASELLNRELSHRIKNVLSVVGSLATMSGEHRPETSSYIAAFQARLNNLAAAHDLLIQAEWGPVMLDGLAERTLASIGVRDRVDLAASGLVVGSHDTQTVALVLHELGTNAIKYGALSNGDGRVALRFEMRPAAASASICWNVSRVGRSPTRRCSTGRRTACAATSRCASPRRAETGKFGRNTCLKPVVSCSFLAWLAAKRSLQRDQGLPRREACG